eukprot:6462884-Amphidinium_carterae.1
MVKFLRSYNTARTCWIFLDDNRGILRKMSVFADLFSMHVPLRLSCGSVGSTVKDRGEKRSEIVASQLVIWRIELWLWSQCGPLLGLLQNYMLQDLQRTLLQWRLMALADIDQVTADVRKALGFATTVEQLSTKEFDHDDHTTKAFTPWMSTSETETCETYRAHLGSNESSAQCCAATGAFEKQRLRRARKAFW